ncbi:hypothetical protein [Gordonia aichiensis]|uniref:hypothetical protein n=1 Tax=Gordonia aichiensis TaxID=36820 RepID=UPI003266C3B1
MPLIAVGAVLLGALATLLILAPWRPDVPTETTATFPLQNSVSVTIRLPVGWTAVPESDEGVPVVMIRAAADERALSQVSDDLVSLGESGAGRPVHAIVLFARRCAGPAPTVGAWRNRDRDDSSPHHTERWLFATSSVDGRDCLNMSGTDAATDPTSAGSTARDLARRLIREDRLTGTKTV